MQVDVFENLDEKSLLKWLYSLAGADSVVSGDKTSQQQVHKTALTGQLRADSVLSGER